MADEILAHDGLARLLEIEFVELTADRVVATMPVNPRLYQPLGYLHGGASLVLAETVASVGAHLGRPPGKLVFGMEINANHVRPKQSGILTAVAVPLHRGQSSQVWDVKISDEAGKLVCVSRCTIAVVTPPPGKEPDHAPATEHPAISDR